MHTHTHTTTYIYTYIKYIYIYKTILNAITIYTTFPELLSSNFMCKNVFWLKNQEIYYSLDLDWQIFFTSFSHIVALTEWVSIFIRKSLFSLSLHSFFERSCQERNVSAEGFFARKCIRWSSVSNMKYARDTEGKKVQKFVVKMCALWRIYARKKVKRFSILIKKQRLIRIRIFR